MVDIVFCFNDDVILRREGIWQKMTEVDKGEGDGVKTHKICMTSFLNAPGNLDAHSRDKDLPKEHRISLVFDLVFSFSD